MIEKYFGGVIPAPTAKEDIDNGTFGYLDKVETERAYEVFDHYTNDLKQNSYIHKRWKELMEKEK